MSEWAEKYHKLSKVHEETLMALGKVTEERNALADEKVHIMDRLRHLLESDFIRSFDELDPVTKAYAKNIADADNMIHVYEEMSIMNARHRHELEMLKECIAKLTMERLGVY